MARQARKIKRKIIQIDEERCDGCGLCVPSCAEGAIQIIDGKARLVAEKYCDGLGACLGDCPQGALQVIEREAEDFDEAAVEEYLRSSSAAASVESGHAHGSQPAAEPMACGCPSAQIQSFGAPSPNPPVMSSEPGCPSAQIRNLAAPQPAVHPGSRHQESAPARSALSHWPIQIRLVPPSAPFLKGADLLVLADCAAVSYPNLHEHLLAGRVVMMGCPKFDDSEAYVEKFVQIFRTAGLKRVTVAMMEVPCCGGLQQIVEQARKEAGVAVPLETVVIGVRGERLETGSRTRVSS